MDPEYEKFYLTRIAELVTGYEKQLADLRIQNGQLIQAIEQLREPPADPARLVDDETISVGGTDAR